MSNSLFLIFNHTFTEAQREDAYNSLDVSRIIDMPDDYKAIWQSIPPELEYISEHIEPIHEWLQYRAETGDYVLIQGDFGACYILVNYAFKLNLVPVYSTTEREANETGLPDGTIKITHHFRHINFRRYERSLFHKMVIFP